MNIEDIISKFLAGEAGAQELKQLEEWRNQSQDNVKELERIQNLQAGANELNGYRSFDTDAAWSKVSAETTPDTEVIAIDRSKKWLTIATAACVALVAFLSIWKGVDLGPQQILHFAANEEAKVESLPDGTVLTLDKGATADIKTDFLVAPIVEVEGRVFFDVAKQTEGKVFQIELNKGHIEVVGTAFSILDNDHNTELAVTEGHVVYHLGNRKVDLFAGDMIKIIDNDILKTSGKIKNYTSWFTKSLVFNSTSLKAAIADIEMHFGQEIVLSNGLDISDCLISGTYKNQSLSSILDEWSTLLDLSYTINKGVVNIQSVVCQ